VVKPPEVISNLRERWVGKKDEKSVVKRGRRRYSSREVDQDRAE
jgi:hypothetical protein